MVSGEFKTSKNISGGEGVHVFATGFPIPCGETYTYGLLLNDSGGSNGLTHRIAINNQGELCSVYRGIPAGDYVFSTLTYFVKQ